MYGEGTAWAGFASARVDGEWAQLEGSYGQVASMPRADGGSGAGIEANSLPRPPVDATDGRGLGGAGDELAGALPRPPEAKGGDVGIAGENDMGQSNANQVRSAIGALRGKQQIELTNSALGLGCRVETLNTAGEGASTDTGRGGNSRDLEGTTEACGGEVGGRGPLARTTEAHQLGEKGGVAASWVQVWVR